MKMQAWFLHAAVIAGLYVLHLTLPVYHHGVVARILVLAVYAMGYNILFGYTGLLSLGHAMFFAAGMYGMGMSAQFWGFTTVAAFGAGMLAALAVSLVVGFLALRTIGVAFMIVTLMFAQAGYLTILYFGEWTRGDEGFVLPSAARNVFGYDLSTADVRYLAALVLFTVAVVITLLLLRSRSGRVLEGIRQNEERTTMLGYNTGRHKFMALVLSGLYSGASGAAYGILFGYVGASFAAVAYSIFPLLWVLLGGAGVVLGPLVGTAFMTYLIDYASSQTDAYMIIVGIVLVVLVLFARRGILGLLQKYIPSWLP